MIVKMYRVPTRGPDLRYDAGDDLPHHAGDGGVLHEREGERPRVAPGGSVGGESHAKSRTDPIATEYALSGSRASQEESGGVEIHVARPHLARCGRHEHGRIRVAGEGGHRSARHRDHHVRVVHGRRAIYEVGR